MNSFTLTAVGNLARNPEHVAKGEMSYTRFCLVGNDYAGKDEEGASREVVTSLWFVAFGPLGEAIARHSRKGDQLIVEARVRANTWTDKQGEKQFDHDFVVQGLRWGAPGKAKREERDGRREETLSLPKPDERLNGRDRNGAADWGDRLDEVNGSVKADDGTEPNTPGGAKGGTDVNQGARADGSTSTNGSASSNGQGSANGAGSRSGGSRSSRKAAVSAA
jgi:single-stranded DNA-binding protein